MRNILIIVLIVIVIGGGVFWFIQSRSGTTVENPSDTQQQEQQNQQQEQQEQATSTEQQDQEEQDQEGNQQPYSTIGTSAGGHDIRAYEFGSGDTHVLFVGGTHGAYDWNTVSLAYTFIDELQENPGMLPSGVRVSVVPALNPDGLNSVIGTTGRFDPSNVPATEQTIPGRFNANGVDLNRNFDCQWQSEGQWRDRTVDGGSAPFSEPESTALRDYVSSFDPDAAVIWYSAGGSVVAASCDGTITSETRELMNTYAAESGYPAQDTFDAYELTGDAANWLAKMDVPAISVILETHESAEWSANRPALNALLEQIAQ
jgi:hypothetical protein